VVVVCKNILKGDVKEMLMIKRHYNVVLILLLIMVPALSGCGGGSSTSDAPGSQWASAKTVAAFSGRCAHTSVVYNNKMWVIGGGNSNSSNLNDVWYSSDGVNWTEATGSAAFAVRNSHTSVVYNDQMWVIGGYNSSSGYLNDVWHAGE
jgi:hypothetical protein